MNNNDPKRICIVANSLSHGGAERSSAGLSKLLHDLGHKVFVVTVLSDISYEYEGELFNLGELKEQHSGWYGRFLRFVALRKFLVNNKVDLIIDNRTRINAFREFFITKFVYRVRTIYVIRNYIDSKVFTRYEWLNRYLYRNEFQVCVSKAATKKYSKKYGFKNILTLYNGFDFGELEKKSLEYIPKLKEPYVLFYGRLDDDHKNISLLLEAYKNSDLKTYGVELVILGDGEDKTKLELIADGDDKINFIRFEKNPYPYVRNAIFTVLTSRHEGFPRVIPESLCLHTPVVSVDCPSGPNEIIVNKYNGLLVDNFDTGKLVSAFNRMFKDKKLYQYCKANARESAEPYEMNIIKRQWKHLIKRVFEE